MSGRCDAAPVITERTGVLYIECPKCGDSWATARTGGAR